MWLPVAGELNDDGTLNWPRGVLMVLYLVGMLWSFMGVGIIADVFMEAIETITATTKVIKGPDGKDYDIKVSHVLNCVLGVTGKAYLNMIPCVLPLTVNAFSHQLPTFRPFLPNYSLSIPIFAGLERDYRQPYPHGPWVVSP